jgi:hypothetical protein
VSFYVSTETFLLLHCDEWDRVVALPRHKFVTGATLLQLYIHRLLSTPTPNVWNRLLAASLDGTQGKKSAYFKTLKKQLEYKYIK